MNRNQIGIYIHIPFCVRKCNYCDFLSFPSNEDTKEKYVEALIRQIEENADLVAGYEVATIYFGGGTPSTLTAEQTGRIVEAVKQHFHPDFSKEDFEFTTEVNPGTVDFNKLKAYRDMGINRLSVGVQSANDVELKMLGRIHSFSQAQETVKLARKAGFSNISMDLISALPGQTLEKYRENVREILSLHPTHISAYSLIVEEGTPFFEKYGPYGDKRASLPDEEIEREMYYMTRDLLSQAGFHRYEISNYAVPGFESRHNSSYWEGTDYLGLGLGAASLIGNVRYRNTADINEYLKAPDSREVDEVLDIKALESEYMILGLRKVKGVSISLFKEKFDQNLLEVYSREIEKSISEGLLLLEGDILRLTDRGLDLSNYVFERFI